MNNAMEMPSYFIFEFSLLNISMYFTTTNNNNKKGLNSLPSKKKKNFLLNRLLFES